MTWMGGGENRKLTVSHHTRNPLADGPHTLRDIWTKFLDDACKIPAQNSAILGRLERDFKNLHWERDTPS